MVNDDGVGVRTGMGMVDADMMVKLFWISVEVDAVRPTPTVASYVTLPVGYKKGHRRMEEQQWCHQDRTYTELSHFQQPRPLRCRNFPFHRIYTAAILPPALLHT